MNLSESLAKPPTFAYLARRPGVYTDADLAAISRAAHALKRRDAISMTGAVIIVAAIGLGMAIAASVCNSIGLTFTSPIAWLILVLPIALVASIVYAASRADPTRGQHAAGILLDAGLCATCAAPLPVAPRIYRLNCAHCNQTWTLSPQHALLTNRESSPPPRASGTMSILTQPWQRDALGTRVPVAAAFAPGVLHASTDQALQQRRSAAFDSMARGVATSNTIISLGTAGVIASIALHTFASGILRGVAIAIIIASIIAILQGIAARYAATRDARLTMLKARLCPCCAADLNESSTTKWTGQPTIQCRRCDSTWYMPISAASTFTPHPGRSTCRCGYTLAGLTPDEHAMVVCPECARRCPLPGHAACAVCDTALVVPKADLYRGTICPNCSMLNRIGMRDEELR